MCGPVPSSFLEYDVGEKHVTIDYKQFKYLEDLGTYSQPYYVFDVHDNGTSVQWRDYDVSWYHPVSVYVCVWV